jgi:hypothetical protein
MAGSRAALRIGLIGGLVLGLAVAAQQVTDSPDLQLLGFVITLSGLSVIGFLGARDAGDYQRWPAVRAGAVAGLIAGLLASLAVIGVLLILSVTGENMQRIDQAIRQMYTPSQLQQFADMGLTVDAISQATVVLQIMCCGAGLPIVGLLLGAMGGAFVPGMYRGRGSGRASGE